ncbi:MAG TPA: 50S ribosomal protein L10 [Candidatus Hydrogenedens sp.]|nr:50S ribosomal protein L10 [Candidatus Hydrogenedens sp.]HOK09987.1 50S ribosomal protein L10 [Candidatus Hydrogenedens sp.]HOL19678.1 50S ribosomal protein L10 [Candidatus Hydrogenedens sp.]HPP59686.1 50S ribosomal protein L10 [Candidatus Hydrogenedens sp.]
MPTKEKIESVNEIRERLESNKIAIMTQYMGINVAQVTELRKKLRDAGIQYKVYKNNLARIALREIGAESAADFMNGPTAWAFCNDPVAPAKILKEFSKEVPFVQIVGGVMEGKVLTKEQVISLATLPPREVLLAQAVGTISAPLRNLVTVLNAIPTSLVNVINQIKKKKEEAQTAA